MEYPNALLDDTSRYIEHHLGDHPFDVGIPNSVTRLRDALTSQMSRESIFRGTPMKSKRKLLSLAFGGLVLGAMFTYATAPVNSVSTVILTGSASPVLRLSAGAGQGLAASALITDDTFTPAAADTDDFTETVNFGTLTNGDIPSVATISLRQRGNTSYKVNWSCSSYTATNIAYNGTTLASAAPSELTMITLNRGTISAGGTGQTTGANYQFADGASFGATFPTAAAVASGTTTKFMNQTSKPSVSGTLTGAGAATNFVQDTATITVPAGLAWSPVAAGAASFSATVQFDIYSGP